MSLVRAETQDNLTAALKRWHARPVSRISHHGGKCCKQAKSWLLALDRSRRVNDSKLSGPGWILQRYPWGPGDWPLYWCQLVEAEYLDCGALADLARTVLAARGIECVSVQLVQLYSADDAQHWTRTWSDAARDVDWIVGPYSYHEACAVLDDEGSVRIWDPTDSVWLSRRVTPGYGAVDAIRIQRPGDVDAPLTWDGLRIEPDVWQVLTQE